MATKRRKRRKLCKHGKLKKPVRTKKGGKRRCKKSKKNRRRSRKKGKSFKMMNIEDNQQKLVLKILKEYRKAINGVASVPVVLHVITRVNILRPASSMTDDRIKKLTAFASDITDRKYHNATLTSTTKHRNCIYQTY